MQAIFHFFWKGALLQGEGYFCLRDFCTVAGVILMMHLLWGQLSPIALTSPQILQRGRPARSQPVLILQGLGPGKPLLTYRCISNGSPDLTCSTWAFSVVPKYSSPRESRQRSLGRVIQLLSVTYMENVRLKKIPWRGGRWLDGVESSF